MDFRNGKARAGDAGSRKIARLDCSNSSKHSQNHDAEQALLDIIIKEVEAHLARGRALRWCETRPTADASIHKVVVGPNRGRVQSWRQGDAADRTYGRRSGWVRP